MGQFTYKIALKHEFSVKEILFLKYRQEGFSIDESFFQGNVAYKLKIASCIELYNEKSMN